MNNPSRHSPRNVAMDYLSRREHSSTELKRKLLAKGFEEEQVDNVLLRLKKENLQCDNRFAQSYIHYRQSKGVGPLKIRHELKQKGVLPDVIDLAEAKENCDWFKLLMTVNNRKYGEQPIKDLKEKEKRNRFFQQRGFAMHDIMRLFTK